MADTFADGTRSIISVLVPRFAGWREVRMQGGVFGYPLRAFMHDESGLSVLSAVEVVNDEQANGPEYHISISKGGTRRCDSNEAAWVLKQFALEGAEEDNHVPSGVVRNFWRTVAEPLIGKECECKDTETAIKEDKGDFIWREAPRAKAGR